MGRSILHPVASARWLALGAWAAALGCVPPASAPTGDPCTDLSARCGAAWAEWCRSECVPEAARAPCAANEACLLCAEGSDGEPYYLGLPSELTYLWTYDMGTDAMDGRAVSPPTGAAFDDGASEWPRIASRSGAWRAFEPYAVEPGDPSGYCEPGPSQFLTRNVSVRDGELVLAAQRIADAAYCDYPLCPPGPYPACGAAPSACEYGETPETTGSGDAAQVDRVDATGAPITYGFGRFRSIHAAGSEAGPTSPGFNYAFFAQSNAYCVDGEENTLSNTGEIDIEISSGTGSIWEAGAYCDERDMCFQLVNWVSSGQGVQHGVERRMTSAFRFRTPELAARFHTWGWDWSEDAVRYTYDSDPDDCDEHAGGCSRENGSIVICEHRRFVPARPGALHLQLWNARWAGDAAEGTRSEMLVRRVWHEPR